ncbi:MAG: VCBS repeat-containing protein [Actinobacteria bacterium]|nr:VCBS repeat-containing protein [Actinomycetota bacterium]
MFHGDESHTGIAVGTGKIDPASGPKVIAEFRIFDSLGAADLGLLRWTSTFALGDVNGDGADDIIATTPDWAEPLVPRADGAPLTDGVVALTYVDGRLQPMWRWVSDLPPGEAGLDTYSPALVDADGDGLLDVVFTARDGFVRALSGLTGEVIWDFDMGRITEAGPMLSDLDGDGVPEVIVVTDCPQGPICEGPDGQALLIVLASQAVGRVSAPLWEMDYGYKMDSAEPAIAVVPGVDSPGNKVVLVGTWGGELLAVWRDASGEVRNTPFSLVSLLPETGHGNPPVIRSSPVVVADTARPEVFFGWLPSDEDAADARFTALRLSSANGAVQFDPVFSIDRYDIWKSSPALVTSAHDEGSLIVAGYGLGIGPNPTQSGPVGLCIDEFLSGGVVAVAPDGSEAWSRDYEGTEGNIRASAAVADIDGDGRLEVVLPSGCSGRLHAFDGLTGDEEWSLDLGPVTQTSPSIGDIDGDGHLEIVIGSYDGLIRVLGA